ncbi:unnamed protein product [Arctia plantaginis]|uniref:Uncharacterized protein n=1 Tax=Arctia plantaginis TaxID=874455 RepID=A0A8S1AH48_ARCPL|nr:unnamed protein product [Arctia plantaginis]
MRSRIFAEKNVDYKRAVELSQALEAAERHASMAGAAAAPHDDGLHRIGAGAAGGSRAQAGAPRPQRACPRCFKIRMASVGLSITTVMCVVNGAI